MFISTVRMSTFSAQLEEIFLRPRTIHHMRELGVLWSENLLRGSVFRRVQDYDLTLSRDAEAANSAEWPLLRYHQKGLRTIDNEIYLFAINVQRAQRVSSGKPTFT